MLIRHNSQGRGVFLLGMCVGCSELPGGNVYLRVCIEPPGFFNIDKQTHKKKLFFLFFQKYWCHFAPCQLFYIFFISEYKGLTWDNMARAVPGQNYDELNQLINDFLANYSEISRDGYVATEDVPKFKEFLRTLVIFLFCC